MTASQYIYDRVPYPSYSFQVSHPDHLATVATLLGMRPPPVELQKSLNTGRLGYSCPQANRSFWLTRLQNCCEIQGCEGVWE